MKLADFAAKRNLSPDQLLPLINRHLPRPITAFTLKRYYFYGPSNATPRQRPQSESIYVAIYRATNGRVTPNDFFDLPKLSASATAARQVAAKARQGGGRSRAVPAGAARLSAASFSSRKANGHGPGKRL